MTPTSASRPDLRSTGVIRIGEQALTHRAHGEPPADETGSATATVSRCARRTSSSSMDTFVQLASARWSPFSRVGRMDGQPIAGWRSRRRPSGQHDSLRRSLHEHPQDGRGQPFARPSSHLGCAIRSGIVDAKLPLGVIQIGAMLACSKRSRRSSVGFAGSRSARSGRGLRNLR